MAQGMHDPNRAGAHGVDDDDDESGLDLGFVLDYAGYVIRAVRLRPALVLGVFLGLSTAAFFVVRALPRTYHVESKLLAQRDASLGHSNPWGDPLKGASDIVMAHDHLVSLVKQLELVSWWGQHLVPLQRAKAWLSQLTGRPPTDEEQGRMLVDILAKNMSVTPGDGTVTFGLDWSDPEMAARLVDTAEQNFLEKRHVLEISTIAESVSILEEHAAKTRKEIEELAQSQGAGGEKPAKTDAAIAAPATAVAPAPRATAPSAGGRAARHTGRRPEVEAELAGMKVMIEAKQRAIAELEGFRERRILDLQANLAEQRSKYTDAHPVIVGIQQNIASISSESPQVATLRSEVKSLQETYDRRSREAEASEARPAGGGGGGGSAVPSTPGTGDVEIASLLSLAPKEDRDPALDAQLGNEIAKFAEIRAQISTARIELDLAQAAFRYRYIVVVPAEPPRGPIKPKSTIILAGAFLASLLLGIILAVVSELRMDRVVHRWQVERHLGLPVLAEVRLPRARYDDQA